MLRASKNAQAVSKEDALLQAVPKIVKLRLPYNEVKLSPKKPHEELHLNFFHYP